MNKILSSLALLFFSFAGEAQMSERSGRISGKIVDNITGLVVEYANVVVMKNATNEMVSGVITDEKGEFLLERIPMGSYYLKVSFIGYKDFKSEEIVIRSDNFSVKAGTIALSTESHNLEAVEIVGEKRLMEYQIDKKVVNVEQNIVNDGGTATDVLSNVASVSVDADGNVSLKGSTDVTILVDGRPMELSGLGLDEIAASTIEAVEIISNPSVKYNPEGMTGIINIKTKKRTATGLNGTVNASVSTSNRHNVSLNLNMGQEKVNFFTNIGINKFEGKNEGNSNTTYEFPDGSEYLHRLESQENEGNRNGLGGSAKFGMDWRINTYNSLMVSVDLRTWGGKFENQSPLSNMYQYNHPDTMLWTRKMVADASSEFRQYGFATNLSYRKTTSRPREEFTIDATVNMFNSNSDARNNQEIIMYPVDITSTSSITRRITDGGGKGIRAEMQANYIYPLGEKGKIETGYQGNIRPLRNKNDYWVNDAFSPDLSHEFDFTQYAHGIYALWADQIGDWGFQVGGRAEYAGSKGTTLVPEGSRAQDTNFTYTYFRFYPTVHLSRKIGKTQEIQLSYSRRVNRPREWHLNPYKDYSDYPFSIEYGNPDLIPEDVHSLEINHSKYWKTTSLYTNIYYRRVNDVIRRYTFMDDSLIRNTTSLNYASGTNYGIDLTLEQAITKWWRMNINGNFYQNITKGNSEIADASLNTEGYSYSFRLNSTMNLPKSFVIQISGRFNGPRFRGQTEMKANWSSDLAIRKSFNKNKWSIGLRLSDVFNTREWSSFTHGADFETDSYRKMLSSRALYLSVSYKINQGDRQQRQAKRGISIEGEAEGGGNGEEN